MKCRSFLFLLCPVIVQQTDFFLENAFLLKNPPILHTHSSISYGQNYLYTAGHTYTHTHKSDE